MENRPDSLMPLRRESRVDRVGADTKRFGVFKAFIITQPDKIGRSAVSRHAVLGSIVGNRGVAAIRAA